MPFLEVLHNKLTSVREGRPIQDAEDVAALEDVHLKFLLYLRGGGTVPGSIAGRVGNTPDPPVWWLATSRAMEAIRRMEVHDRAQEPAARALLFQSARAFSEEGVPPEPDDVLLRTLAAVARAHRRLVEERQSQQPEQRAADVPGCGGDAAVEGRQLTGVGALHAAAAVARYVKRRHPGDDYDDHHDEDPRRNVKRRPEA